MTACPDCGHRSDHHVDPGGCAIGTCACDLSSKEIDALGRTTYGQWSALSRAVCDVVEAVRAARHGRATVVKENKK